MSATALRSGFVRRVYANQNDSRAVRRAVRRCLERLPRTGRVLNVGAGVTRLDPSIVNVDVAASPTIDCLGRAEHLPFPAETFAVVLTQETLEHVRDPCEGVREIHRVLQAGGTLYCQLPFVIGYHPGPSDYWRFTREGIQALVENAGFRCEDVGIAVGGGTGMYRIAVEFVATLLSVLWPRLYSLGKGAAALCLAPLRLLDPVFARSPQADRIPGGYYVIAIKM